MYVASPMQLMYLAKLGIDLNVVQFDNNFKLERLQVAHMVIYTKCNLPPPLPPWTWIWTLIHPLGEIPLPRHASSDETDTAKFTFETESEVAWIYTKEISLYRHVTVKLNKNYYFKCKS